MQVFKKMFALLLSEELIFRASLYYCGKEKESFIHSCIWTALSPTLIFLDSSLFSASEAKLSCHLPVIASWRSSVKLDVFYEIFLQFVISDSKFQPKIQKYNLSQFFLNLAIKNSSDFLNVGNKTRYFVTLNAQIKNDQSSIQFFSALYAYTLYSNNSELHYSQHIQEYI